MSLPELVAIARNKAYFTDIDRYIEFCRRYLEFIETGLQAEIVSQNENHHRFYQYKAEGHYNISRPVNSRLMYRSDATDILTRDFPDVLRSVRDLPTTDLERRDILTRSIYTIQQSIGATLDALPANASNFARKINGDLFERLIQLLVRMVGVECSMGTVQVPVYVDDQLQFKMSYQHDLLLYRGDELKVIGSVKTSSKDRIDKILALTYLTHQAKL